MKIEDAISEIRRLRDIQMSEVTNGAIEFVVKTQFGRVEAQSYAPITSMGILTGFIYNETTLWSFQEPDDVMRFRLHCDVLAILMAAHIQPVDPFVDPRFNIVGMTLERLQRMLGTHVDKEQAIMLQKELEEYQQGLLDTLEPLIQEVYEQMQEGNDV